MAEAEQVIGAVKSIHSVEDYIGKVKTDTQEWDCHLALPWFRGQTDVERAPLPSILRSEMREQETAIIARFRSLAPMFGEAPSRDQKGEWLYLRYRNFKVLLAHGG